MMLQKRKLILMEERLRSYNLLYRYSFKHMPKRTRACLVLQKQDQDIKDKVIWKAKQYNYLKQDTIY